MTRKSRAPKMHRSRALIPATAIDPQPIREYVQPVIETFSDETENDLRGSLRRRVQIRAEIRETGGGRFDTWVSDISQTGFRMQLLCRLDTDKAVLLMLPGIKPLRARIAWREGNYYGCMFETPLHVAVFDHISRQF